MYFRTTAVAAMLALAVGAAWSHGSGHEKKPAAKAAHVNAEEHAFGRTGDPEERRDGAFPYMAHVAPGKTDEIVWQFTRAGELFYACLIPGHLEAGIIAKITVK